jgi:Winged helix DNA-binding domain
MTKLDIATQRLHNQQIENTNLKAPSEVVAWLGAMQAQDYAGAKWAIGLRSQSVTDTDVEQAFTHGKILRTHVLRPTWHFVTPEDIRWLLKLTAPRVHALNAYQYRQLELEDTIFKRSHDVFIKTLQGGKQLTRLELAKVLEQAGIAAKGSRLAHIVMQAELEGVICSGARRGKQFTYALLEERAPHAKSLERDEALAELVKRYFSSHGPATLQDFVWWSGLTVTETRIGLEYAKSHLIQETIEGQTYWFSPNIKSATSTNIHLLPWFDEFLVAYKDRSAALSLANTKQVNAGGGMLNPTIVGKGQVVGTWKSILKKDMAILRLTIFRSLEETEKNSLAVAAERYGTFLAKSVLLEGWN